MEHKRIDVNPGIMFGKPVIKETRITVEHILRKLAGGMTADEIISGVGWRAVPFAHGRRGVVATREPGATRDARGDHPGRRRGDDVPLARRGDGPARHAGRPQPHQPAAQYDLEPGCGLTTRNAVIALCARLGRAAAAGAGSGGGGEDNRKVFRFC